MSIIPQKKKKVFGQKEKKRGGNRENCNVSSHKNSISYDHT